MFYDQSDESLMWLTSADDAKAFEALVQRHQRGVVEALYRRTRNTGAAQDLAQDVFLELFRARRSYRRDMAFSDWLSSITEAVLRRYEKRGRSNPRDEI
jgi:RNA polymerase sigma-70 factor, ECF subfamily